MFDKIIELSLKYRVLVIALFILMAVFGLQSLKGMTVDVFPDLNKPSVTLLVETDGLAPEEMEKLVLIPIENTLNGGAGISRLYASASVGYGIVKAEFDWKTDVFRARQIVTERIGQIQSSFPEDTRLTMTPVTSIMGEVMLIGLTGDEETVSPMQLREVAEIQIRKRLLSVPGVASVSALGGDVKQYQIILDTMQMHLLGITMDEAEEAVRASGLNGTGGFFKEPHTEALIRIIGRPETADDMKKIVIAKEGRSKGLPAVRLGQIADIKIAPEPNKRGDAGINGKRGVLISIAKQPDVDTVRLTEALETEIASLEKTLPSGIRLEKDLFKQSRFIQNSIDNISAALIEGAILVAIILFVFLVNFRGTAIVLTVMPATLLMTAIVFNLLGLSINTMTLGGIAMALGSLIDDAIVDMQNVYKRLKENRKKGNPKSVLSVVFEASKEVRNAIIFSTVLIFLVFLPMFAMEGIEGKIFTPLAVSFILSMVCSTLVAVTLTPVMSAYLLPKVKSLGREKDTVFVAAIKAVHAKALAFGFRHIKGVFVALALLLAVSVGIGTTFGKEFLPPFNEGSFNITVATPPGTNLEESGRIGQQAEQALLTIPEVETTGRKQGRAELDEHALGVNIHEIEVRLKDKLKRGKEEIETEIRNVLDIPGVAVAIGQPIAHRIDFIISGVQAGLVVKIFGTSGETLSHLAEDIEKIMRENPDLVDVRRDAQIDIPQMHVRLDREKAARYGVQMMPAVRTIEMALSGKAVAEILENERAYDVVLRMKGINPEDLSAVKRIPVMTIRGDQVALGTIADIFQTKGTGEISRENTTRCLKVQANFKTRDMAKTVAALKSEINEKIILPQGTFLQFDGQFKTRQEASQNIVVLGILSFALLFGALYVNFKSLNLAAQLMVSIPFAVIGGILGVFLTSGTVSVATMIGMVALVGIAIRNGILLMELYVRQGEEELEALTPEKMIMLTQERLEPVMMTTLTSILGFVPLLVAGNTAGKEILYPVAAVVAFGLVTTTALNLILTPLLFYRFRSKS